MKNKKIFILLGIILAILLCSLDQMIVSTAMPKIVSELNGMERLSWVFTSYMLASTIIMAIYGKLSDLFGRKYLYMIAIVIFLLGSVLSGLSQNMTQLILFRAVQGIGGGGMMIISFALIADVFEPQVQAKYQGMIGGVSALSSIIGPLLGGWISDHFSWRWIFYINMPIGIFALIIIAAALPTLKQKVKASAIDYAGALLMSATLIPMLLILVWGGNNYAWDSWQIFTLSAITVVSLAGFILAEKRAKNAILSLDLFRNRVFFVSAAGSFITAMALFGVILFIPLFAQAVVGVTATHSGLILTPMMLALIVSAVISGQIISRTGKYKLLALAGMVIGALAMYLLAQVNLDTTNSMLVLDMCILGCGIGLTMPIFMLTAQNAFSRNRLGEATSGAQLFKNLGGTVGAAVLGGLMNTQLGNRLTNIGNEPFVQMMKKMKPAGAMEMNARTVQGILNPDAQKHIRAMIGQAPANVQMQVTGAFNHFLEVLKIAFSQSLDVLFLVSTAIMAAGFLVVLFMPEISLKKAVGTEPEALLMDIEPVG